MSVSTVSDVPANAHAEALRAKHHMLSQKIEEVQKSPSPTNFRLNRLKKEKLLIKEKLLMAEEKRQATG